MSSTWSSTETLPAGTSDKYLLPLHTLFSAPHYTCLIKYSCVFKGRCGLKVAGSVSILFCQLNFSMLDTEIWAILWQSIHNDCQKKGFYSSPDADWSAEHAAHYYSGIMVKKWMLKFNFTLNHCWFIYLFFQIYIITSLQHALVTVLWDNHLFTYPIITGGTLCTVWTAWHANHKNHFTDNNSRSKNRTVCSEHASILCKPLLNYYVLYYNSFIHTSLCTNM